MQGEANTKTTPASAEKLLSKFFRRASPRSANSARARIFMEDAIRRAERSLLDKKRTQAYVFSKEQQAEILAEELFHSPGSLLSAKEIAHIYHESKCEEQRDTVNCNEISDVNVFRTANGACNNLGNPAQGASFTRFDRILPPTYEDGIGQLRGFIQSQNDRIFANGPFTPPNPSARLISINVVRDLPENETDLTHLIMQWGQFVDHDLDLAVEPSGVECDLETCEGSDFCAPVRVPEDDEDFGIGTPRDGNCHPFVRTVPSCFLENPGEFEPRQQVNELTSYLDGSMVYGSTKERAEFLREFEGGRLRVGPNFPTADTIQGFRFRPSRPSRPRSSRPRSRYRSDSTEQSPSESSFEGGDSLPTAPQCPPEFPPDSTAEDCCPPGFEECFVVGDVRVNEQVSLTVMHTLWLREHNRIARELEALNSHWGDDRIYSETRKILGAQIQKITLYDYLPLILGKKAFTKLIGSYSGYNPNVDASIPNAFAAAAYRFGHSQIQPQFDRLKSNFQPIPEGPLSLANAFFNPDAYFESGGTDPIARGWITQPARRVDEFLNSILTSRLFENGNGQGLDLATLNIQRGRDHGIPPYRIWRNFCKNTFGIRSGFSNELTTIRFLQTYGALDTIDLWVGGLAEEPLSRATVGSTFACIFAITFSKLRAGDRFWFENPVVFTPEQVDEIRHASLSRVICDNADNINKIQRNAFRLNQERESCDDLPSINLKLWQESYTNSVGKDVQDLEHELAEVLNKHDGGESPVSSESDDLDADTDDIVAALAGLLEDEKVMVINTNNAHDTCFIVHSLQ